METIGTHCTLRSCNVADFLPIRCPACTLPFCREHAQPDQHACSSIVPATTAPPQTGRARARTCDVDGCEEAPMLVNSSTSTGDGVGATCAHCTGAFCIAHRFPASHACQPPTQASTSGPTRAQALLAKHFPATAVSNPTSSSKKKPKLPSDPVKLAQYRAVQLMKMRHQAVPADERDAKASVRVEDRLHVRLRVECQGEGEEKVMWFRKSIITGRALDLLAARFKLPHDPGVTDPSRTLQLVLPSTGEPLVLNQPLDGQLEDGGDLWLVRGGVS